MTLDISADKTIGEIRRHFSEAYPFLRLDFYKRSGTGNGREKIGDSLRLGSAGLLSPGTMEIEDATTVGDLEAGFQKNFGLNIQVVRRSGILWLETTMTDKWTLKQQNDHGKELSQPG